MYIVTKDGLYNSDRIAAFKVVEPSPEYQQAGISKYRLCAYPGGDKKDDNGNEDCFWIKTYDNPADAYADLDKIRVSYRGDERTVDLSK